MAEMLRNWQTLVAQLLPATLLGAVAFALALVITDPVGPGLDPDALSYMGAAESVAEHGIYQIPAAKWTSADSTAPLAHFPPGYSTILALPVRLGMKPPQAARLVQATSAFITIFTLVLLVSAAATPLAGILLAVALFAMTSMHEVHASVLSEPLYLACMSLVLAAMVYAPDRPLRAGIPAAVGVMTRYAGASLVGAVALWSLMQPGTWMQRVKRAAFALLPAVVLQGIWIVRTRIAASAGAEEIRKFAVYGDLRPTLAQGAATLVAWIVPDPLASSEPIVHRGAIAVVAGFALVVLMSIGIWRAWRATRARDDVDASFAWRFFTAGALLLVCYLGIVGISRLLADPDIPLDERILAPALVLATTLAATALALWWRGTRLIIARIAVCGALLGWWFAAASATYGEARYALEWGSDFAGEQWRHSELLDWARHDRGTLYSNWPAAVYFHLHRPARELPKEFDAATLKAFADTVRVRGGRVLLFDVAASEYAPTALLVKVPGLRTVARLSDGVVLSSSR
ncbi:MAG: hypothetical protein JWL61_1054 [Gemmatimonadetes bacterium]|nr:hypothetical protein [Gemmatimonadota bacterium]